MKTVKVAEATKLQLDYLVAKCTGDFAIYHDIEQGQRFLNLWTGSVFLKYSSLWSCGGPIIERESIAVGDAGGSWVAGKSWADEFFSSFVQYGPTPLIAAMRCFVISKLGETVEIPEELE